MSRNFFPAVMAIGMGVFTGYYAFQPALRELQHDRVQGQINTSTEQAAERKESPPAPSSDSKAPSEPTLSDNQMQVLLLERENKRRLEAVRAEQDAILSGQQAQPQQQATTAQTTVENGQKESGK